MTRSLASGDVEVAVDLRAEVGEGPVWDGERHELVWVDIPRGTVHRSEVSTGRTRSVSLGQPVGAVAPREAGGLVAAVRDGFAFTDPDGGGSEMVAHVEEDVPGNRMNDGKCDRAGRFWAGTMADDMRAGAGSLYRLGPGLEVERVLGGLSVSNGLAWAPDDATMYFIDSGAGSVDAFDYDADTGDIGNRRSIAAIPEAEGLPDGMAIDADGCLWVAVWGAGQVRRYTPAGRLDTVVELPATQVTSCAFGGRALDELFITSAASGLGEAANREQPHAGAVFRVVPGVTGAPPDPFRG